MQVTLTTSGLSLRSMHHACHGWEPPLTTKTASFAGCLDYIWLSGSTPMASPPSTSTAFSALSPPAVAEGTSWSLSPLGGSSSDPSSSPSEPHCRVDHFRVLQTLGLPYLLSSGGAKEPAAGVGGAAAAGINSDRDGSRGAFVVEGTEGSGAAETNFVTKTAPPPPCWLDPMVDFNFPPIPNMTFPSDHLAMG